MRLAIMVNTEQYEIVGIAFSLEFQKDKLQMPDIHFLCRISIKSSSEEGNLKGTGCTQPV